MSDTIRIHQFTALQSPDGQRFAQVEVRSSAGRGHDVAFLRTGPMAHFGDVGADAPCWVEELGNGSRGHAVRAANARIGALRQMAYRAVTIELPTASVIDGLPSVSRSEFERAVRAVRAAAEVRKAALPARQWYARAMFS